MNSIERFWTKVNKTSTCWLWLGTKYVNGYGQFKLYRKNVRAHRFSWELLRGKIPQNMLSLFSTCE